MRVMNKKVLTLAMSLFIGAIYLPPCQAKGFFTKSKNFVVKAIKAPVKMVTGLFHKKKKDLAVPATQAHIELLKELVKKRNDLLWVNQKALLEDLVNNKSTKITRGEMFLCELEHEEKILGIIEKEMSHLCYETVSGNMSDEKFVKDVQWELVQTILLKERMQKLLQIIKKQ